MIRVQKELLFLVVLVLLCMTASAEAGLCIIIDSLSGKTEVQRAGRQVWQPAVRGMKLDNNDIIRILPQGYACLGWPDGSITYLRQKSQMRINIIPDEGPKEKPFGHATLYFGTVFFFVKEIAPRGLFDDCSMRVYTPTASLSIHGTAFQAAVDDKTGATSIKVLSGTVQVHNIFNNVSLYLGSPYQTIVSKNSALAAPEVVMQMDIDTLTSWVPQPVIAGIMEKQITKSKTDFNILTGKSEDKCIITPFTNSSSYTGPWPITARSAQWLAESFRKAMPRVSFLVKDSADIDPIELARANKARFVILPTFEVFDISQHEEISPRVDEVRQYAAATVSVRLRLIDAASGKKVGENSYSGEATDPDLQGNSLPAINRLTFDISDTKFAASIMGTALQRAFDQAAKKTAKYLE
jgi:hypothetical protein